MKEGRTAVVVVDGHRTPWDVATSLARHSSVTVTCHILFSHALDGPRRTGSLRLNQCAPSSRGRSNTASSRSAASVLTCSISRYSLFRGSLTYTYRAQK